MNPHVDTLHSHEKRRREQDRLAELRRFEILDTRPEPCFDRLTQLAARSCDTPMAVISIVDEHRLWFKSCYGLVATEASRAHALCAETIRSVEPLVVTDASLDPRFDAGPLVVNAPHIRFYAGVPLISAAGFALGSLCVVDRRPRTLTEEQIDNLKILAQQTLQQFESHRMAETLRRQSESLARTQAAAHIGGWELDLKSQRLSWSEETYRIHEVLPDAYAPDVDTAIAFYSASSAAQIREAVDVLIETGTPYDLELQLVTRTGRHRWVRTTGHRDPSAENGRRLYGIFQDITERRNLESEVILIAQREQNRIGLDLHDGLGQDLTGVSLLLRKATADIPESSHQLRRDFQEIEALVANAIGTCRGLAHGLAPVSQERGGLPHALAKLGNQLGHVHGIRISVEVHGLAQPRESIADHIYRIAQEALTNAVRHSGATRIELRVELDPAYVSLCVTDDGAGIAEKPSSDGMGISIMRYRARLIGASLTIEPRAAGGTRVACRLDLAHRTEPARDAAWGFQDRVLRPSRR